MFRLPRPAWLLILSVGVLILLNQFIQALTGLYESIASVSGWLANGVMLTILVTTLAILGVGIRWIRPEPTKPIQTSRPRPAKLTSNHIQQSLDQADTLIARLHSTITRQALKAKAQEISSELQSEQFHLVIFGSSSAGKTSLVNALLGRWVGETAPTLGTTESGSVHTYEIPGLNGSILLTDTPGLQTIGQTGEAEAKTLAKAADLLVFVVAGDLLASEYSELLELARCGKRAVLVLNKIDQLMPEDRDLILNRLREQTAEVIPAQNVVALSADPQPLKVRHIFEDGTISETYEPQSPDPQPLVIQIAEILQRQGRNLRLANALLQTQTLAAAAQEALQQEQLSQGRRIVERMQWATAAVVAATPIPALDILAAVAINARLIGELHALFNRRISLKQAQAAAQSLAQVMVRLGGVELATQTIGSVLKASPLAVMGMPLQAASAAYLTRIAGLSYLEWLQSGDPWQEEAMANRIRGQLNQHRQRPFLKRLARQTLKLISGDT